MIKHSLQTLFTILIILCFSSQSIRAQQAIKEKQKAFLGLKYVEENGKARVYFNVYTLQGAKRNPVQFTIVNLFLEEESKWGMMGNITTDSFGQGFVPLAKRFALASDSMTEFHLIGSLKNDPRLLDTQTRINIKPATLELSLYRQDTTRYAKATLKEKDSSGVWVPAPGVKVVFFVEKYFTLLPEVFTDENGEALLEVPDGLKGDDMGRIKIVAKVDANNNYGTLIATAEENWGDYDNSMGFLERLLSIIFIIGIFIIIIYFIRQIFKSRN